jgi:predicted transposase/invertase (TIGR01784 family)
MKDVDDYYHYFHLVHDKYTEKVIDGLHLIFVELKKFKPQTFSEKKMQALWLRFLTEITDKTLEAPAELLEDPEVSEALKILEIGAYSPGEMRAYDRFWDYISRQKTIEGDNRRMIEKANAEIAEANAEIAEAKAEIEKLRQDKFDTARKLKAMNVMTTAQIAEATGLAAKEIDAL